MNWKFGIKWSLLFGLLFSLIFMACESKDDSSQLPQVISESNGYIGTWEGELTYNGQSFNNFPISTQVIKGGDEYSGRFWMSDDYTSCCGNGQDNGVVS